MRMTCLPVLALLTAATAVQAQAAPELPLVAVQVDTAAPEAEAPGGPAAATAAPSEAATVEVVVEAVEPNLEALRWIARPVVVFADTENDPRFRQQMELLGRDEGDLLARDVVILVDTDAGTLSDLRRELRPRDFTIVLIDKDGTVVQRRPAPTTVRELTHTIDRLPSRRQETGSFRQ